MADFFQRVEQSMGMDDQSWARHANPWSGWTRVPILPLLALAIWARAWIGWWCLVPVTALVIWAFVNPRAFPKPESLDNWMSKAVLGERLFLARQRLAIPGHHVWWGIALSIVAGVGILPLAYGLWVFDLWAVFLGLALTVGGKLWFLDRMVWLHADMQS